MGLSVCLNLIQYNILSFLYSSIKGSLLIHCSTQGICEVSLFDEGYINAYL